MNTRSVWRPDKDEVVVEHGAVATAHPIAAQVGVDILKNGGNAVDAAIATGFCLNVVEPASSSIAGHGQMIVHIAAQNDRNPDRSVAIDYGHRAPRAATADMFRVIGQSVSGNGIYDVEDRANAVGHRSVGVPGVTAGMCRAHELFGSLPLEQLLEPAVHYAREGSRSIQPLAYRSPETCPTCSASRASSCKTDIRRTYLSPCPFEGEIQRGSQDNATFFPPSPGEKILQRDSGQHPRTDRQERQRRTLQRRDRSGHRRRDEAKRRNPQFSRPRRLRSPVTPTRPIHLPKPRDPRLTRSRRYNHCSSDTEHPRKLRSAVA